MNLFISNILPGIFSLIGSFLILSIIKDDYQFSELFQNILLIEGSLESNRAFIEDIPLLILISLVFAISVGYFSAKLIRWLRLDIRFLIFRYKNTWHYVFSGEISDFSKFKDQIVVKSLRKGKSKYFPPKVDILIGSRGEKKLYSGLLLDYEITQGDKDILSLERVYMNKTKRYRKTEGETSKKSTEIPGDLFILDTSDMLNISITFPDESLKAKHDEALNKRNETIHNWLSFFIVLLLLFYIVSLFTNFGIDYLKNFTWYQKLYVMFIVFQVLNIFYPERIIEKADKDEDVVKYKYLASKIIAAIIILIAMCIGYYYWFI